MKLMTIAHEAGITNLLLSWREVKGRFFERIAPYLVGKRILLDPGYGTGGRPEDYLAFAREYHELFDGCLAWDVPGAGALVNTHWFLWFGSAGLPKMIPVFHPGMPWRFLGAMQAMCGRVAAGGLLLMEPKYRTAYLDELFFLPDGSLRNPKLRVHGLGMDNPKIAERYPWDSLDATTWLNPIRFGKGGTVIEAINRQGAKTVKPWRYTERQRFLTDPAHDFGFGLRTIGPDEKWRLA